MSKSWFSFAFDCLSILTLGRKTIRTLSTKPRLSSYFKLFLAVLVLYYILQDKSVPLHIRRAFYDAHSEMDHTTSKLQAAAEDLKKCLENVLHEDDLNKRASSMTDAHYQSLKQIFAGGIGHKDSAMLHWLQLSMNLENPGQGNVFYEACKREEQD